MDQFFQISSKYRIYIAREIHLNYCKIFLMPLKTPMNVLASTFGDSLGVFTLFIKTAEIHFKSFNFGEDIINITRLAYRSI